MHLSVIGCGYLGAVHAAAMAHLGHRVVGIESDASRAQSLEHGQAPFFEPGLEHLLEDALAEGRLAFATNPKAAAGARVHFLCVGTPQLSDGLGADLGALETAVDGLKGLLRPGDLVVGKSTVPVGTARRLRQQISATGAALVWNPEFLREGMAVADTLNPDRLIYGVDPVDTSAVELLDKVYQGILRGGRPRIVMSLESAELVKMSANSFLALKISFTNAIADLCTKTGGDVAQVAAGIGLDPRIGPDGLQAGLGFGGGCLPKDLNAMIATATSLGLPDQARLFSAAEQINSQRVPVAMAAIKQAVGGRLDGTHVAMLGLAFKPGTDDVRHSQPLELARQLSAAGAVVTATDPKALANARAGLPGLGLFETVEQAVEDAEVIVLATPWDQYRQLDPAKLLAATDARIVIDPWRVLDVSQWHNHGWQITSIGRVNSPPQ